MSTRNGWGFMLIRRVVAAALLATVTALIGVGVSPVSAETIDIPVVEAYVSGAPGSVLSIGTTTVDAAMVGRSCDVVVNVINGASVHAGNKMIVTSGESRVEIANVEDVADGVTHQGGTLTLGSSIEVSVMFGADGVSSLGSSATVTCKAAPVSPPPPAVVAKPTYTG